MLLWQDKEIEEAGCCDGGDFLLSLRNQSKEDDWLDACYARRGETSIMKPAQPAHRCLSHLILLMIRTIEKSGAVGTQDLYITKKELGIYGNYVGLKDRTK